MTASSAAEAAVKKLARLPSNTVCPNCGTQKNFGFTTVCIKYLTFVCNNCKASHQAISHRCKSLTMSSWTEGEVLALKKAGNDRARATWLAKAPPPGQGGRPKEGDPIDVFKSFIVDVYERKRYFEEGASEVEPDPAAPPQPFATVKAISSPRSRVPPTPNNTIGAPAAPPPAAPPIADLLDFGTFVDTTPAAPPPQLQQAQSQLFDDAFSGFSSQPATAPPPVFPPSPLAPPSFANVDPFGAQSTMQAPSFDPFSINNNYGGSQLPTSKPPAMRNVTGLANAPVPTMGMQSQFTNPGIMYHQPMGNGMMGSGMTMNGGHATGGLMGGNFETMIGNSPRIMMMNAQQQMMMLQMAQNQNATMMGGQVGMPSYGFPGNPYAPSSGISSNSMGSTATMMNSVGFTGGAATPSPQHRQHQQPKKDDPFAGIGL